ncbi:uncharacterized protein VTP21DRAFT_7354 [Calcarisporiella thermophila]|uniref:uncharacterized protein n=1 Tax=Calcarisporiella thermophila TaxID=911321 RepID=UPI0037447A0C
MKSVTLAHTSGSGLPPTISHSYIPSDLTMSLDADPSRIQQLLTLLPSLPPSTLSATLKDLLAFADRTPLNKWRLICAQLPTLLLRIMARLNSNELFEQCVRLLASICSYSVKPSDIKMILNMICCQKREAKNEEGTSSGETMGSQSGYLFWLLCSIGTRQMSLPFFHFSGPASGMQVEGGLALPANGYGLCVWLKPDFSFAATQRLFSFLTSNGSGVEAYFGAGGTLQVQTKVDGKAHSLVCSHRFTVGQWYFVCITHSRVRKGWSEGTVTEMLVMVDEEVVGRQPLPYPPVEEEYTRVSIAGRVDEEGHMGCSLSGAMAAVYFLEGAMSLLEMKTIHALGPAHATQFSPEQLSQIKPYSFASILSGLASRLIFCYHVCASRDDTCFNLATKPKGVGAARIFNTEKCLTRSFQNALQCLGGIAILFPLLLRLDQLALSSSSSGTGLSSWLDTQDDDMLSTSTDRAFRSFFRLLASLLAQDPTAQTEVLRTGSLRTVSMLIQQVCGCKLSIAAYQCLVSFANSLAESPELEREAYAALIFEFKLWANAEFSVQAYCLDFLTSFVEARIGLCRDLFGVQFFLDAAKQYYFPASLDNECSDAGLADRKEKAAQCSILRSKILNITKLLMRDAIRGEDVTCMLRHLLHIGDTDRAGEEAEVYKDEILQALDEVIRANGTIGARQFNAAGGAEILIHVMLQAKSSVRARGMEMLLDFTGDQGKWAHSPLCIVQLALGKEGRVTPRVYDAVLRTPPFNELVKTGNKSSSISLPLSSSSGSTGRNGGAPQYVMGPRGVKLLLILSGQRGDVGVKSRMLLDIYEALKNRPRLALLIDEQEVWQAWMLEILAPRQRDAEDEESMIEVRNLALETTRTILWNLLVQKEGGFEATRKMVLLVWMAAGIDEAIRILTRVLVDAYRYWPGGVKTGDASILNIWRLVSFCSVIITNQATLENSVIRTYDLPRPNVFIGDEVSEGPTCIVDSGENGYSTINNISLQGYPEFQAAFLRIVERLDENGWLGHSTAVKLETEEDTCFFILKILLLSLESTAIDLAKQAARLTEHFLQKHMSSERTSIAVPCSCSLSQQRILSTLGVLHRLYRSKEAIHSEITSLFIVAYSHCRSLLSVLAPETTLFMFKYSDSCSEAELDRFAQFTRSLVWDKIVKQHLSLAECEASEEDMMTIQKIIKGTRERIVSMLTALHDEHKKGYQAVRSLTSKMESAVTTRILEERSRVTALQAQRKRNHVKILKQWLLMLHEITRERGAWWEGPTEKVHWKLDRVENFSRMRPRLVINYAFHPHLDASSKRDRTAAKEGKEPTTWPTSVLLRERIRQLAIARVGGHSRDVAWDTLSTHSGMSNETDLDRELDEEWNLIEGEDVVSVSDAQGSSETSGPERTVYRAECDMVVLLATIRGQLNLTTRALHFSVDRESLLTELGNIERGESMIDPDLLGDHEWPLSMIREIFLRNYMLRKSALEIFMTDHTNYFFHFLNPRDRIVLFRRIVALRPPSLLTTEPRTPAEMLRRSNLVQRWQRHEISNFAYLMCLNSIAGRSFNDLAQYFVFPWILADYSSESLDLTDPRIYRDLSKPIGALEPRRLSQFLERYESFEDPSGRVRKFHYGTHYSSAATVASYLLRMEPFTSVHIALQGGKFDHADRQFHSMDSTWHSCLNASGDVRELIPEFFYMPEFLVNQNGFDLGIRQDGNRVDDVVLPKWARTPEEFIKIHRDALESDYVSDNLHHWIDLIFGYKQRGEAAVRAHNVFYYLTYEGAINLDDIDDPTELKSIESQIYHFGQTPTQLLRRPHPRRFSRADYTRVTLFARPRHHRMLAFELDSREPIVFIGTSNTAMTAAVAGLSSGNAGRDQRIVTLDEKGTIGSHQFSATSSGWDMGFTLEIETGLESKRRFTTPYRFDARVKPTCFACNTDGKILFIGGLWDNSLQAVAADTGRVVASVQIGDGDLITCLAVSEDGRSLVAGSASTAVAVFEMVVVGFGAPIVRPRPRLMTYGHDDEIRCVGVNAEHDMMVSGSKDGTCIVYSLGSGQYIRTLRPFGDGEKTGSVERVRITHRGQVIAYSERGGEWCIHVLSINGKLLKSRRLPSRLNDLVSSSDGRYVVVALEEAQVSIFDLEDLSLVYDYTLPEVARSVALSDHQQQIILGCEGGKLIVISCDLRR